MKILITGSSGFLGIHVVAEAQRHGWQVGGVDNRMPPDGVAVPCPFHLEDYGRITESQLEGVDTLIHFAGYTSLNGFSDHLKENYANNVSAFNSLLDLTRRSGVRKVVYASSSAVYMDGNGTNFCEDEPIDHLRLGSHYGKTKLIDEMIAASYAAAFGMNLLGLRYFNVYGLGDERKGNRCAPIQHFVNSRANGEPIKLFFDGKQAKDFIHVDDAIAITFRLIDADARGVYNVGTGVATTFNRVAEILGGPVEFAQHPSPFGYQYFTKADTTKMLAAIGPYDFIDVRSGVERMMTASDKSRIRGKCGRPDVATKVEDAHGRARILSMEH